VIVITRVSEKLRASGVAIAAQVRGVSPNILQRQYAVEILIDAAAPSVFFSRSVTF
jgi:hypothetical protein